jgi:hypothetical protein
VNRAPVPMVTYLACFIVCDFDYQEKYTQRHNTKFRNGNQGIWSQTQPKYFYTQTTRLFFLSQRSFRGLTRPCEKLKAVFRYNGTRPQDAETPLLLQLQFCYPTLQCNCSACNVPPGAGLQKQANFSTLIAGLAGTGDQIRATCVAGSSENHSAIHYDWVSTLCIA